MVQQPFFKWCRNNKECMNMSNVQNVGGYVQKWDDILEINVVVLKIVRWMSCRNRQQEEV